jgi:2-polyprenyl-3-methyl-5-hydroxy-6-metoxy-1,4-benzoquinol methylase
MAREALLPAESKARLGSRLAAFYRSTGTYTAFLQASQEADCWRHIAQDVIERNASARNCGESPSKIRILEVGSGRSGFGDWLATQGLRGSVHWTAQDITETNKGWLQERADRFLAQPIDALEVDAVFDIIFSTYVLEHVCEPEEHLARLASLLAPQGKLYVFCPRYDLPGYLCPSSRHLPTATRARMAARVVAERVRCLLTGEPSFLVQTDIAAFHAPFYTDADAVHWVSLWDLRAWARRKGLRCRSLQRGNPRFLSKDWIVKRYLACAVVMSARPSTA